MTRICIIALCGVCAWAQQQLTRWNNPGQSPFPEPGAPFQALPLDIPPPIPPERPSGGSISLAQLRHRVPKEARKLFLRAARLAKREDHAGAAKELEAAVRLDPEYAGAYEQLGIEYGELRRPSDAAVIFRRLLELSPDSVGAHCYLGMALLQMGDRGQGEEQIRRALRLSPGDARCQFLLGYLLWQQEPTRDEGLARIHEAARTLPYAKKVLRSLQ